MKAILLSSLLVCLYFAIEIKGDRFGSPSETLHFHSRNDGNGYGGRYQIITAPKNEEFRNLGALHRRTRRQLRPSVQGNDIASVVTPHLSVMKTVAKVSVLHPSQRNCK